MPSLPELQISLPRWIGIFRWWRQQGEHPNNHLEDSGGEGGGGGVVEEESPTTISESSPVECYACTQVGVPAFHSTSCDRVHPPEWEASAGSSLIAIQYQNHRRWAGGSGGGGGGGESKLNRRRSLKGPLGRVLDPRSKEVQRWNRAFLLARGMALAIDPLFFYALSIGRDGTPCLYMDGGLAAIVTVLRTIVDAVHLFHLCLQLRLAYVSKESLVVGCGKLVWDASAIASHYLRSFKGFWFDAFVILPVPQVVFWLVVPKLIREEKIKLIMTILLLMFLFQFLPKVYHSICIMRRMQKVTGYIFGTIWWGFALNLIAYFIASHVAGGCWYVLAIDRVASCLGKQCDRGKKCKLSLSCANEICYRLPLLLNPCSNNSTTVPPIGIPNVPVCLNGNGPFPYGIYKSALPIVSSNSIVVKILYPIFWGLMTLSTFGNDLEPTSHWLEVIFSIIVVLSGLMLFTLLIGNIQVFLHSVMARKRKMQLRCRDLEWWMRRRQLPSHLRQRVRRFERQRWAAMGGEDEMDLIKDLPEGLRRDIKRYLCLDLIKKVPLFHNLDDLILDNICDRVKPLVFSKDEKIIREGDPVQRMVFVVNGQLRSSQKLSKGMEATCILGPGSFLGDELLSWCLRRPFNIDRLPTSSATFVCVEATEAFGLESQNLRYITEHFRYKFGNERLKRTARYYSSNWRTWAAVNVQLAWRRYMKRTRGPMIQATENGNGNGDGDSDRLLMRYAALFMSLRPHDHLE
ncbi:cyclic nucleotide-gated ion channel 2-like [Telopea speciosissima]|uniref:cyclic nucleotide-gated ion channel 2-like n=1 Tax=Telopea speciosissima TaxID=54955 RepID=UPI001CC7EDD7|nr:cyclic nucleotide-gated ion channel 2-like [Telopea speciosissima]